MTDYAGKVVGSEKVLTHKKAPPHGRGCFFMLPGNNSVHFTLAIIASYGLSTSALAPLSSIPS